MKIFNTFILKGNMINRKYKATRNASYLLNAIGSSQTLYEWWGQILFGKPLNPANAILGMSHITLGMSLKYCSQILQPDYLRILECAKNINLIRNIRQRHTNTAVDNVIRLLTNR